MICMMYLTGSSGVSSRVCHPVLPVPSYPCRLCRPCPASCLPARAVLALGAGVNTDTVHRCSTSTTVSASTISSTSILCCAVFHVYVVCVEFVI